jgi:small subunit ribosomal protein S17e
VNRVRKIALEIFERNKTLFTPDFEKNKVALNQVAIIRSRQLRNQIAGYLTSLVKNQLDEKQEEKPVQEVLANTG